MSVIELSEQSYIRMSGAEREVLRDDGNLLKLLRAANLMGLRGREIRAVSTYHDVATNKVFVRLDDNPADPAPLK